MDSSQARSSGSPPQWSNRTVVRPYCYTHSQPQWSQVMRNPGAATGDSGDPPVTRAPPLLPPHRCTSCGLPKQLCSCTECAVCCCAIGRGTRHHCRKCWRAVCGSCWLKFRYVHMRGRPVRVCDSCAVPWGLANLCKREERGLFWGLYLLRRAGEMPSMCVAPKCRTLTYYPVCYVCGTATVMTQPHLECLVRVDTSRVEDLDKVRVLDATAHSLRDAEVDAMPARTVHDTFRRCFHRYEEVLSFRGVLSSLEAQDILLSIVAAAISYEYHSAPNLTLLYSDVPYAKLLKIQCARPRYTIFEAPGKVKFVAFPGTHNWRTRWADLNFAQEPMQVWAPLVEGIRIDPDTGEAVPLCGGVREVWAYKVHAGFAQEARDVGLPMDQLIEDVRNGYRLVFSGHSLGGAVAQLLTVQMLARHPNELSMPNAGDHRVGEAKTNLGDANTSGCTGKILCVSIGAPLVGNYQFVERVEGSGWAGRFHNIVYRTDIVPRLSCSDELTWDVTSQLLNRMHALYRSVQSCFTFSRGDEATTTAAAAAAAASRAAHVVAEAVSGGRVSVGGTGPGSIELPAGAVRENRERGTLENYVDSAIRRGRDVIEGATTAALTSGGLQDEAGRTSADEEAEGVDEDVADIVEQIRKGKETSASNRLHRRFTCFGRYHFLAFGKYGYVSTADSELAFGILKRGCGDNAILLDHSVGSYNRGVMLHLYGKKQQ